MFKTNQNVEKSQTVVYIKCPHESTVVFKKVPLFTPPPPTRTGVTATVRKDNFSTVSTIDNNYLYCFIVRMQIILTE